MPFTSMELMICCAARELEDGKTVAVGTGLPCAAAMLAQRTHAPNLVVMFEAGGIAPQLPTMPVSVGDSTTFHRALMATSMADVMQFCQRGMVDYTFLSGAQIDAKRRFHEAVAAAGPGLSDILWRIVCAGEGMREAETALGWPVRAGKLVLTLALDRVASYYRIAE